MDEESPTARGRKKNTWFKVASFPFLFASRAAERQRNIFAGTKKSVN
jgi:hypothetical protein